MPTPVEHIAPLIQWILFFAALMFIGGPLVIWLTFKINASPQIIAVQHEELDPAVRAYFDRAAPALAAQGFTCTAYVNIPNQVGGVQASVALWINRAAGDTASVIASRTIINKTIVVGFDTQLSDDTRIETSNWAQPGIFAPVPKRKKLHVPGVQDVHRLYQIHRARVERLSPPDTLAIVPSPGKELEALRQETDDDLRQQVAAGRLYYDEKRNAYRAHFLTAFPMSWGLTWPFSMFRRWMRRRQAALELRELGLHKAPVAPPPLPLTRT